MALYDALEAMDYGCSGGVMTFEAAKQAVDDSLSPCVLSKMNGDILHVNAAWTNLCGYSLDEAQGKSFSILQGKETNGKEAKKFVQNLHKDKIAETTLINYTKSGEAFPHCIAAQRLTNSRNGSDEGFYLTQSREAPVVAQSSAEHMVLKLLVIALVVAMVLGQLASQSTGESGRGRDESWFDMIDPNYGGSKHLDGFLYLGDERAFHAAFSSVHGSAPII